MFTQRREGAKKRFVRRRGGAESGDLMAASAALEKGLYPASKDGEEPLARRAILSAPPRLRENLSSSLCAFAPSREQLA
jgi:hypothetical protein